MSDGRRSVRYDPEAAIAAFTEADPKLGELIRTRGPVHHAAEEPALAL